jgi:hypothetical protein
VGPVILVSCWSTAHFVSQSSHILTFHQPTYRLRSHAGQQDHYTCYILRHLRKILLLLAIPHNDDAVRACIHLAALPPSTTSVVADVSVVEKWHAEEHGSVGLGIRLTMDDLEKLHFLLQVPSGGGIDDPPLDVGKHLWKLLYRSTPIPTNATIPLGEVERALRQQLTEGYQKHLRPDVTLSKLSLQTKKKFLLLLKPRHISKNFLTTDCEELPFY